MEASLSNVVNISIQESGALASRDNMNICAVFTSQLGKLNSANRTESYTNAAQVEADFGSNSAAYSHALTFFSQSPNPVAAGGRLIMAYHRAVSETTVATSGKLTSIQLAEDTIVGQMQAIQDGSFLLSIDSVEQSITGLDFRTVSTLVDIIAVIQAEITGSVISIVDQKIIITSSSTGATSLVSFLSENTSGTFIGDILYLASGTGAIVIDGLASQVLTAETKLEAVNLAATAWNFKGFVFISNPTDVETIALGEYALASDKIYYDVLSALTNLEKDVDNVAWNVVLAGLKNCRLLFSKSNQRRLATAYMARNHVVNFTGSNTTLTMNLKELKTVTAEEYSQSEIDKAKVVGLDLYVLFAKNTTGILTSGANDFVDNVYNLLAYKDAIQTSIFNVLKGTSTKIPQTQTGINTLINALEKTTDGFVRANFISAGAWSSSDFFGDYDTFFRAIEKDGYYIMFGSLADQEQASRELRESPTGQIAIKYAGAIHSVNLIVNINK